MLPTGGPPVLSLLSHQEAGEKPLTCTTPPALLARVMVVYKARAAQDGGPWNGAGTEEEERQTGKLLYL